MIKVRTSTFQTKTKNTVTQICQKKNSLKLVYLGILLLLFITNVKNYLQRILTVEDIVFGLLWSFNLQYIQQYTRFIKVYKFETLKWVHESEVDKEWNCEHKKVFNDFTNNIPLHRHHHQNFRQCRDFHNQYICKLQIIFTVFTVCSELNFGRANNYVHSTVGDEISFGITGMYASPEYSQP